MKKLLALFLAFTMIFSSVAALAEIDITLDTIEIYDADDLRTVAESVYATNYKNKTIILMNDIDLKNEEWTPIGNSNNKFAGTFNGNGKTISNLKITKGLENTAENNCVGLFGRTESPAVIKNLTIENVDISGSLYVGAVVGYGYTGNEISNVTVKGDIAIDAWWYAGVIGGNGYMGLVDNCHVIGNDGSYIKGNNGSYIGGIWGFRGEGNNKITNCSVTNLSITGVDRVGGISGIAHYGNTISGCDVSSSTVEATDPEATTVGIIAGACQGTESNPSVVEDNTVADDVTASVAGTPISGTVGTNINGSKPNVETEAAKVGTTYYDSLEEAIIAAAPNGTVDIVSDITVDTWKMFWPGSKNNECIHEDINGLTINGNGYSLTVNSIVSKGNGNQLFKAVENLNISDLTINTADGFAGGIGLKSGKIENVTFNGGIYGVYADGNDITIKDCTFNNLNGTAIYYEDALNLTVANNTFNSDGKNAIILRGAETFTGNNIVASRGVTVASSSSANISGNTFADGVRIKVYNESTAAINNNTLSVIEFSEDGDVNSTFNGNILSDAARDTLAAKNFTPVAQIGNADYYTLQDAVAAAQSGDKVKLVKDIEFNDTITINDGADVILDMNGKKITSTDAKTSNYEIFYNYGTLTVTGNGTIELTALNDRNWNAYSSIFHNRGGVLNIENGTFKHHGGTDMAYIIDNSGNYYGDATTNIEDGTLSSTYIAIRNRMEQNSHGASGTAYLNVNGGTISGTSRAIWAQAASVNDAAPATGVINITGGNIGLVDTPRSTGAQSMTNISGDAVVSALKAENGEFSIIGGTVGELNILDVQGNALDADDIIIPAITGGTFGVDPTAYLATGYDAIVDTYGMYKVVGAADADETISVVFEEVYGVNEGEKLYNINLVADSNNPAALINRLNSADLTFFFNPSPVKGSEMAYEILGVDKISVTAHPDEADRYMFNFDCKDSVNDTANTITIGQVKVTGYGSFTFEVVGGTNEVHATTINDNVVDTFIPNGDVAKGEGKLDITNKITAVNAVPVRTLTVQVAFPNAINDNSADYQDMKITVKGNIDGEEKEVVRNLGATTNGGYVEEFDNLVLNNTYNVTVSGAGYRTARYTVTMTEAKTLNFWNNVKDKAEAIEVGKETGKVATTFLAGDIVKDNNINIYDLSAVVSYFGSESTVANGYAKYDLNRDGKIDSKDVAYVLVSWDK